MCLSQANATNNCRGITRLHETSELQILSHHGTLHNDLFTFAVDNPLRSYGTCMRREF